MREIEVYEIQNMVEDVRVDYDRIRRKDNKNRNELAFLRCFAALEFAASAFKDEKKRRDTCGK